VQHLGSRENFTLHSNRYVIFTVQLCSYYNRQRDCVFASICLLVCLLLESVKIILWMF